MSVVSGGGPRMYLDILQLEQTLLKKVNQA